MRTRRDVLRSGAKLAVISLPGCSQGRARGPSKVQAENNTTPPTTENNTTSPSSNESSGPTIGPSSVIDVRDFGVKADGSTDDTAAINSAIQEAEQGDTVFFPPGTMRVRSDEEGAIRVDDSVPDGVTLLGGGKKTVIKMLDVDDERKQWCLGVERSKPIANLEIRNMRISGNKAVNSGRSAFGINVLDVDYGEPGHDIRIEDVETFDCSGKGISVRVGSVELDRVTSRGNTRHGINAKPDREMPDGEWSVHGRNLLCENNGVYGIDHDRGSAKFERFWLGNNSNGSKVTREVKESWWVDGTFAQNELAGFRYNGPMEEQLHTPMKVHLDNLVSEGNRDFGFYLAGDVDYDVGTIVARRNNASGQGRSNIQVIERAAVDAKEVYAVDAVNGHGLFYYSDRESTIGLYQHANNPKGGFDGKESNVSIDQDVEGDAPRLDVPDKAEVGADFDVIDEQSFE